MAFALNTTIRAIAEHQAKPNEHTTLDEGSLGAVSSMLESMVRALTPMYTLSELIWDDLPPNSGCTMAEVKIMVDRVERSVRGITVPYFVSAKTPEQGYAAAIEDFLAILTGATKL